MKAALSMLAACWFVYAPAPCGAQEATTDASAAEAVTTSDAPTAQTSGPVITVGSYGAIAPPVVDGWAPTPQPLPRARNPRIEQRPDMRLVMLGSILGGIGWLGTIVVGSFALAGANITGGTCDQNLGLLLVPIVGMPIGFSVAYSCRPPATSGVSGILVLFLDIVAEAGQVGGLVLGLFGGLVGDQFVISESVTMRVTPTSLTLSF